MFAVADVRDHRIDDIEHRRRRPEARLDRQIAEFERGARPCIFARFEQRGRLLANPVPRALEFMRVGALEAEDRLLEVADHEERAASAPRARPAPAKNSAASAWTISHCCAVGVLAFVDEDVIGPPVELVADPVPHARGCEQLPGPGDQVVEVGDAGAALRPRVGGRERLPRPQARGHVGGKPAPFWTTQKLADQDGEAAGVRFVVRLGPRLARRDPQSYPFRSGRPCEAPASSAARSIGVSASQFAMASAWPKPGLRAPPAVRVGDRFEQVAVEAVVVAMMREEVFDRLIRQVHRAARSRCSISLRRAQARPSPPDARRSASGSGPRLPRPGAG